MQITFKSNNGLCPQYVIDNTKYYLYEGKDSFGESGWCLRSKPTYRFIKYPKNNPNILLQRYFRGKKYSKNYSGDYTFYYINNKIFGIDGKRIVIFYDWKYESGYYKTYAECLENAKKLIENRHFEKQLKIC